MRLLISLLTIHLTLACLAPHISFAEEKNPPQIKVHEYVTDDFFFAVHFKAHAVFNHPLLADLPLSDAMGGGPLDFSNLQSVLIMTGPISAGVEPLSADNRYENRTEVAVVFINEKPFSGEFLEFVTDHPDKKTFQGFEYWPPDHSGGPWTHLSKDKKVVIVSGFEEALKNVMVGKNESELGKRLAAASVDSDVAAAYFAPSKEDRSKVARLFKETLFMTRIEEEHLNEEGQFETKRIVEPGQIPPPLNELIELASEAQVSLKLSSDPLITGSAKAGSPEDAERLNYLLEQTVTQGKTLLEPALPKMAKELVLSGLIPQKVVPKNKKRRSRLIKNYAAEFAEMLTSAEQAINVSVNDMELSLTVAKPEWLPRLVAISKPSIEEGASRQRRYAAMRTGDRYVSACEEFERDLGRFPKSLNELVTAPKGESDQWKGPYLAEGLQPDPWGNAYEYKLKGDDKDELYIRSAGQDGKFDSDDDVVPYSIRWREERSLLDE